jgi:hypothetical protein
LERNINKNSTKKSKVGRPPKDAKLILKKKEKFTLKVDGE